MRSSFRHLAAPLVCCLSLPFPAGALADDRLLPPASACGSAATNAKAAHGALVKSMNCLVRKVRARAGRRALRTRADLTWAAAYKSVDIAECGFTHTACGRDWTFRAVASSYADQTYSLGENLAMGLGTFGSPRAVMNAWLASEHHRANLLNRRWRHLGSWVNPADGKNGWVLYLGCRC